MLEVNRKIAKEYEKELGEVERELEECGGGEEYAMIKKAYDKVEREFEQMKNAYY